jgi:hypothetical protein
MEVNKSKEEQEPGQQTGSARMNNQHAPTAMTESHERLSSARLHGRWIMLARGIWITLVILTLAIFGASLPVYIALRQTLCAGTECASGELLTSAQAEVLTGIGLSLSDYAAYSVAFTLATIVVCLGVSTLIVWHRSDDRMALLVALMLVMFGPFETMPTILARPSSWQVPAECLVFLAVALFVLVFLLFPTGRFVPSFTRWIAVVSLAVLVLAFLPNTPVTQNPSALFVGWLVSLGIVATLALVQLYRYRRISSPLQRQQTKWVVFGLAVPCAVLVGGFGLAIIPALGDSSAPTAASYQLAFGAILGCTLLLIPLSFGFAMLRSRLWDIDVLINRTLVYGTLTVILTAVYVGLVIGLQALLRSIISHDSGVAIVLSTLAIYMLFQPLRRRIQRIIDRRFYRSKYDAAKTVAAFSSTLRAQVDLDQLREHLLAVVQETMQPSHVSLWLRPPAHDEKRKPWRAIPPLSSEERERGEKGEASILISSL